MITIIDYGIGNCGSIQNMLKKIGHQSQITSDSDKISSAEKLILPGVGSFDVAMTSLKEKHLVTTLNGSVKRGVPILGICLGMQIMAKRSEEGQLNGLGWIDAEVLKMPNQTVCVPHMGWNTIKVKKENCLFKDMYPNPRFYFVHSYYVRCNDAGDVLTETINGIPFCSSFAKANVMGVQFHPEKSHKYGMKLLKNFVESG